eukprot:SAG25_NODE_1871_length_2225_cov_2.872531_1_plen_90_part_00
MLATAGRQTIIYCTVLGQLTNFRCGMLSTESYVAAHTLSTAVGSYAFMPGQLWLVFMWTVWNSSMNGLAAASNFALSMDCLPVSFSELN